MTDSFKVQSVTRDSTKASNLQQWDHGGVVVFPVDHHENQAVSNVHDYHNHLVLHKSFSQTVAATLTADQMRHINIFTAITELSGISYF